MKKFLIPLAAALLLGACDESSTGMLQAMNESMAASNPYSYGYGYTPAPYNPYANGPDFQASNARMNDAFNQARQQTTYTVNNPSSVGYNTPNYCRWCQVQ